MTTLLDLLLLQPIDQASTKEIRCIWNGTERPASINEMKRFSLCELKAPRVQREARALSCRGEIQFHFEINQTRFSYAARFLSFVHLDISSPPRCIAVYVLARLFPRRWHELYKLAFWQALHHRAESNVNRFTQVFPEPTPFELVQMASLFVVYVRGTKDMEKRLFDAQRRLFDGLRNIVAPAFAEKRTRRFHLTLFLSMAVYSLSDSGKRKFVDFLKFHATETSRNLDRFYELWQPLPSVPIEIYVPCAISLFCLE